MRERERRRVGGRHVTLNRVVFPPNGADVVWSDSGTGQPDGLFNLPSQRFTISTSRERLSGWFIFTLIFVINKTSGWTSSIADSTKTFIGVGRPRRTILACSIGLLNLLRQLKLFVFSDACWAARACSNTRKVIMTSAGCFLPESSSIMHGHPSALDFWRFCLTEFAYSAGWWRMLSAIGLYVVAHLAHSTYHPSRFYPSISVCSCSLHLLIGFISFLRWHRTFSLITLHLVMNASETKRRQTKTYKNWSRPFRTV